MSKRIKDIKWELDFASPHKWFAHEVCNDGKNVLLKKYNDDDDWEYIGHNKEYLVVTLLDDGHSISKNVYPKKMDQIFSCNFLPNGDLFIVGFDRSPPAGGASITSYGDDTNFHTDFEAGNMSLRFCIMDTIYGRIKNEKIIHFDSAFGKEIGGAFKKILSETNLEKEIRHLIADQQSNHKVSICNSDSKYPHKFLYKIEIYKYKNSGTISFLFDDKLSVIDNIQSSKNIHDDPRETSYMTRSGLNSNEFTKFTPPKLISGRNWRRIPVIVSSTDSNKRPLALLFDAGRKINVFKDQKKIDISLNFGHYYGDPKNIYMIDNCMGHLQLNNKFVSMEFNFDSSRLVVLSYLPYNLKKGNYTDRREHPEPYQWRVTSYDIDGRAVEIERTKHRKEGSWKLQSLRKVRTDALANAGLPVHIAKLIAMNKIEDKEGIKLFHYLRSGGVPEINTNEKDSLEKIDEMVFSGRLLKEDAKWLIGNRNHVELIEAIIQNNFTIKEAKKILIDMGFANYPEAVTRIVNGSAPETVAMIFGIEMETNSNAQEIAEEKIPDTIEEKLESKEKRKAFFRRRGRFS